LSTEWRLRRMKCACPYEGITTEKRSAAVRAPAASLAGGGLRALTKSAIWVDSNTVRTD